ncbi:MAG: AAA family ATPase [Pseudomonadota bacterium]
MALILLIGPPAVGKMTVGQELERLLGFKLFHNHVTIEMVAPYFGYDSPEGRRLVRQLRSVFFDAFAANTGGGFIFTYVWAFGEPGEREHIEGLAGRFGRAGHPIFWVELEADLSERQRRNRTENRLTHKPTKRDLDWSEQHVLEVEENYRLNSNEGEIVQANYLRIDNTNMSPSEVAELICAHFGLVSPRTD